MPIGDGAASRPSKSKPAGGPAEPAVRMAALVVDDSREWARVTARMLESAGYAVEVVTTTADALARVAMGGLDAVVTDMLLRPTGTGDDVARAAVAAGVPRVVAMSGVATSCAVDGVPLVSKDALGDLVLAIEGSERPAVSRPRRQWWQR